MNAALTTLIAKILFPNVSLSSKKLRTAVSGKTILITGASYGIGEQLTLLLSEYNVHLVISARSEKKLYALKSQVEQNGSLCTVIVADLYEEGDAELIISKVVDDLKIVDIVISNAGKSIMRPLHDSLDRFHDITRTTMVNYLSPARIILALTPLLENSKGKLINVSAVNVLLLPAPQWAAYQASKSAFDQWFRSNQAEWATMGIRTKTIYLPLVKTNMIAPNKIYSSMPAMRPEQAAARILKLLYTPRSYSKPWWSVFPETASFFFRFIWERSLPAIVRSIQNGKSF